MNTDEKCPHKRPPHGRGRDELDAVAERLSKMAVNRNVHVVDIVKSLGCLLAALIREQMACCARCRQHARLWASAIQAEVHRAEFESSPTDGAPVQ